MNTSCSDELSPHHLMCCPVLPGPGQLLPARLGTGSMSFSPKTSLQSGENLQRRKSLFRLRKGPLGRGMHQPSLGFSWGHLCLLSPCCQISFAALRKQRKAPYLYLILRLNFAFLCNCCTNVRGVRMRRAKGPGNLFRMEKDGWTCPLRGHWAK